LVRKLLLNENLQTIESFFDEALQEL